MEDATTVVLPMDKLPCPTCGKVGSIDWGTVICRACGAQLRVFMTVQGSPESVDDRQQQRHDAEAE
jgi:hypothetical protein